jgi:hypothetical protein
MTGLGGNLVRKGVGTVPVAESAVFAILGDL